MSEDTIKLAYLRRREQELDQILNEQRQQITALAEERARLLAEIAKDTIEDLQERRDLLADIQRREQEADWTPLDELQARARLLGIIEEAERDADWTPLDELQARARLLGTIEEGEDA
jgi:hypothetical protein